MRTNNNCLNTFKVNYIIYEKNDTAVLLEGIAKINNKKWYQKNYNYEMSPPFQFYPFIKIYFVSMEINLYYFFYLKSNLK